MHDARARLHGFGFGHHRYEVLGTCWAETKRLDLSLFVVGELGVNQYDRRMSNTYFLRSPQLIRCVEIHNANLLVKAGFGTGTKEGIDGLRSGLAEAPPSFLINTKCHVISKATHQD